MKRFPVFIIVLLSSFIKVFPCGFEPYGEELRYSLFLPEYFDYQDFENFYYNADQFGFYTEYENQYESNVYDWYQFTHKKVPVEDINNCLNHLKYSDIHEQSSNLFLQYLYNNKFLNVIEYIKTAKKCEDFNSFEVEDPWEKDVHLKLKYDTFIKELTQKLEHEKMTWLKRKYAFLTIRTAYYNENPKLIKELFNTYFTKSNKDYLYYWALYYTCFKKSNNELDLAKIMAFSKEKRNATYYHFHSSFRIQKALSKTKDSTEIALLYAYVSVQRLAPNLDYLIKIYENSNKLKILDFLLLREINKIEDWVFTPYYTNYYPITVSYNIRWKDYIDNRFSTNLLRERSEKERRYAQKLLDFVSSVDDTKIMNVPLWKAAEIELLFITRDYQTCLTKIGEFEKKYSHTKSKELIEKLKALCLISNQVPGKAIIKDQIKPIILKYINETPFVFALGRELEFLGNISDGMALISYQNSKTSTYYYFYEYYENNGFKSVFWRGNRQQKSGNLVYFHNYFDYLDFVYSVDDLQKIVTKIETPLTGDFYNKIYSTLVHDKNYLTDMLGTKYIRENRLYEALKIFESLGPQYWEDNYNSWERDRFSDGYYFDQNPFYDIKYTKSFIPHEEKYIVTKLSVIKHLIKYLEIANNPKNENQDYYYFLVANCYLGMSQYGHAWMMRRFNFTTSFMEYNDDSYIDEREYRNGELAQHFYHLAYLHAKTKPFKALCLRMEEYVIDPERKFKKLKKIFPEYYEDLSSCENLELYFKNRR
jgi:hypothetical protein